jgi:outer membrane protein insertion porin family
MNFRLNGVAVPMTAAAVIATVVAGSGAPAAHAQAAQQGQIIGTVTIRGVRNTNPDVVRSVVTNAGLREGQPFQPSALADVRKRITDTGLYSDVYINPTVTADRRVVLTIEVFENPVISEVRIRTNVPLKGKNAVRPETILPRLGSQPNLVVNVNTVRADARVIQEAYRKAGYDAYLSEIEDVFDPKTNILTFPVTITVVDAIEITNLKKTRPFVVQREMKTKVGEPLNRDLVQRDTTRIFATGLFSDVQNPQVEVVEEGHARLVIPVTEQRTGQVQVGFGYSVQQRLTGTLEIAENNFRGRGQGVSASWTVGGFSARNQFELGFTEPWLDKNNTSFSASLYNRFIYRFNRMLSSAATDGQSSNPYFEERKGGSVTLSRPVSDFMRVYATLRTESVRANNLQVNVGQLTFDQVNSIQSALVQDGHTNAVAFRALLNTRDNERDPASGAYFSPSVELGVSRFDYRQPRVNPAFFSPAKTPGVVPFLTDSRKQNGGFTKYNTDYRRYFTLDKVKQRVTLTEPKHVLATRLLIGTSAGNIGFSEQYFMGGADNLRGYADDRFWGNSLFLVSTEYRSPLANKGDVTGVLFVDVGDAWGGTAENRGSITGFLQHRNFKPNVGFGFGVRIKTPVGPVRLDYGIGETQRTHFSIGQAF